MRLDRFISNATALSRAETQRTIRGGRVTIAGETVRDPARHIAAHDRITLDGEAVTERSARYLMLNKPAGYICATTDGSHPTVIDLLHEPQREGLHPAGRLDIDTTGLVLISDDGEWSHRITSPRRECPKRYRVELAEPLADNVEEIFAHGLLLKGESKPTRPAQLQRLSTRRALLTIHEGKYHQVKRMFAAVGNHVTALHRESIGAIELDPALAPGAYRHLTAQEIDSL